MVVHLQVLVSSVLGGRGGWSPSRTERRSAWQAFAVKQSVKAYLSGRDDWATSYYSELLLDTLFEDTDAAEIKELETWYVNSTVQEQVDSVCHKITTDDKFLQNMMRSVDLRQTWNP